MLGSSAVSRYLWTGVEFDGFGGVAAERAAW